MRSHPSRPARISILIFCLSLLAPAAANAQATTGSVAGKVTDAATSDPIAAVNVVLFDLDGNATRYGAFTSADGTYRVINILPGTYNIRFAMIGYDVAEVTEVTVVAGETSDYVVALRKMTTGFIVGQVTDHGTGEPLAGVTIALMDVLSEQVFHQGSTGTDGRFRFANVPPGRYNVRAIMPGYKTVEVQQVLVSAGVVTRHNFQMEAGQ
ncbi:carboxypeptidase regulatory-like domain-containing protein [Gemmatimonadota bacterium]